MRNRRLTVAASAALILLIGGSAAIAWKSNIAERERALAEKRFGDVRKLAGKVLIDYYEEAGRRPNSLALREKLAADSVTYLDALAVDADSNLDLLQEVATGYERLGSIHGRNWDANTGKPEIGRQHFKKAMALREKIFALKPDDVASAAALASTLQEMADLEGAAGKVGDAVALASRGIALLEPAIEKTVASGPLASATTLGKLYRLRGSFDSCAGTNTRGRAAEGLALLKSKRAFFDQLAARADSTAEVRAQHAEYLLELGAAGSCRGDFATGTEALTRAMAVFESLERSEKTPLHYRIQTAMVEIELATVHWQRGDYPQAVGVAQSAYRRFAPLAGSNPDDIGQRQRWLVVTIKTAGFMLAAGRAEDVRDIDLYLRDARATADHIVKVMPSNQYARIAQTRAGLIENRIAALRGDSAKAVAAQKKLIADWERDLDPNNALAVVTRARLYATLARVYPRTARAEACRALDTASTVNLDSLATDRKKLSESLALIEDAILAREWSTASFRCGEEKFQLEAMKLTEEMLARGVQHLRLPGFLARLKAE